MTNSVSFPCNLISRPLTSQFLKYSLPTLEFASLLMTLETKFQFWIIFQFSPTYTTSSKTKSKSFYISNLGFYFLIFNDINN